jgi:hypothetical protein
MNKEAVKLMLIGNMRGITDLGRAQKIVFGPLRISAGRMPKFRRLSVKDGSGSHQESSFVPFLRILQLYDILTAIFSEHNCSTQSLIPSIWLNAKKEDRRSPTLSKTENLPFHSIF